MVVRALKNANNNEPECPRIKVHKDCSRKGQELRGGKAAREAERL